MDAPFFSIVIPTYNRAHLVGLILDSVRQQVFPDFEVLVVDDGSTENTEAVVGAAGATDPRVKYLPKTNAERGAARNYGLAHARGTYALFLDSDDRLHPTHLAALYAATKG